MITSVANEDQIAERLTSAKKRDGRTDDEIIASAECDLNTLYRYTRGEIPQGCVRLVRLGLAVGLNPNALFLHEFTPATVPNLTEADYADLRVCVDLLAELSIGFGEKDRPCPTLRAALSGMVARRRSEESAGVALETGTVIAQGADRIKTYDAPSGSKGPSRISKVSSPPARYGKKKRVKS